VLSPSGALDPVLGWSTFSLYARAAHYCARDAHPIKLLPDLVLVEFEQPIMGSDWPPDVYVDRALSRALLR
jgi:hypothetical protein